MSFRNRMVGAALLAVLVWALGSATALADEQPPLAPAVLMSANFEAGYPAGFTVNGVSSATSWWGPVAGQGTGGSTGLWVAGTGGTWPSYEIANGGIGGTQGLAGADLSSLADYYSATVDFDYKMPSLLPKDTDAFAAFWQYLPGNGSVTAASVPITTSYLHRTCALSSAGQQVVLSRRAGAFYFRFNQGVGAGSGGAQGPTIDNVVVKAWKYGPVRNLQTSGNNLTWARPLRSTVRAASTEERSITYRVWRRSAGQTSWTELTAGSRLADAGATVTYDTGSPASGSAFIVQTWDPGTGTGYGQVAGVASAAIGRTAGINRYDTAVQASQSHFGGGSVQNIVIASGANFPDALSAAGLAGAAGSPVLLVPANTTVGTNPAAMTLVENEISRITTGTPKLWVVGGTGSTAAPVIPDAVVTHIKNATGISQVQRLAGVNRYQTSQLVANQVQTFVGGSFAHKAFVVDGGTFQDALTVGPVAYGQKWPVILTSPTSLSAYTSSALTGNGITSAYVVGSTANVNATVFTAIGKLSGVTPVRVTGASSAYQRSADFATWAMTYVPGVGPGVTGISSGANYPDGLGSSAPLGANNGIGLLTDPSSLSAPAASFLTANKLLVGKATIFGGTGAVSPAVETVVKTALH